jgi:hypothetical protein
MSENSAHFPPTPCDCLVHLGSVSLITSCLGTGSNASYELIIRVFRLPATSSLSDSNIPLTTYPCTTPSLFLPLTSGNVPIQSHPCPLPVFCSKFLKAILLKSSTSETTVKRKQIRHCQLMWTLPYASWVAGCNGNHGATATRYFPST